MRRADRLFDILQVLRDNGLHRARDLADRFQVSERTIYRDMEMLAASGVPVEGERGHGYMMRAAATLPPLTLTPRELEALNLGIAIVAEAADPELRSAAESLGDKIDAAQATRSVDHADAWKFAASPFANAARGLSHMATLRAAIKARQKLQIRYFETDGTGADHTIRPLQLDHWGRVWTLTAWCESHDGFRRFRVDLIDSAAALPELFPDTPGMQLSDFNEGGFGT